MRILITGAAGLLGGYMAQVLENKHDLVLTDIRLPEKKTKNFVRADLTDFKAMQKLCKGIDVVLHFGASCDKHTPWEALLPNNIIGVRNIFEAAAQVGCKRVIFASSLNTVNGYSLEKPIPARATQKPLEQYGVTKIFGETLGSYYADSRNLSVLCLRFGRIISKDDPRIQIINDAGEKYPGCDRMIIHEDAAQLIQKCIAAPKKMHYWVFNALSDNRKKRMDISETKKMLGYKPKYDAFEIADKKSTNRGQ